jgi:ABC-2 type transport system ATP-binding protein
MQTIISVSGLSKTYDSRFQALKCIDLDIRRGEIFALLGPNGAGKTTLISIICGIVKASEGKVRVDGHDIVTDYRAARAMIGLVPQELTTDAFESVWATVSFSRGLFGKPANPEHIEKVLRDLSLWDKKDNKIITLSGGMKRRLLIAKALSHEPEILFLDEPTAGVDVNLRRDMWQLVRSLQASGVTIILTTHYIDEAEEMADRIGVISKGEIILVDDKAELMRKLGKKQMTLHLQTPLEHIPPALAAYQLELELLSAPVSYLEIAASYVGAAATKSIVLGLIILATAGLFVPLQVAHPWWMILFLVLTAVTFSLFGFIIGIWADNFEKLQLVPLLIITPLTFLGGSFYSIDVLPPVWQTITLFNPVVYLVSGFRWSFYGIADVAVGISLAMTLLFLAVFLAIVAWIFKTGYRLKN